MKETETEVKMSLGGFSDAELRYELQRRQAEKQKKFRCQVESGSFGLSLDVKSLIDVQIGDLDEPLNDPEHLHTELNEYDMILLCGLGQHGIKPREVCLPHQIYVETVETLLAEPGCTDVVAYPLFSASAVHLLKKQK